MKRISIFLITLALIVGMIPCMVACGGSESYTLTIKSTSGGVVATNNVVSNETVSFTYGVGEVVNLDAIPDTVYYFAELNDTAGSLDTSPDNVYDFVEWTGDVDNIADVAASTITIAMNGDYSITANFGLGIRNWYDLDIIRDSLDGHHTLVNDLNSTTLGYEELAGPTANEGKGWEPIGKFAGDNDFIGTFDGQGHEIHDLCINGTGDPVGLFGLVVEGGVIENIGVVDTNVTGQHNVGSLVGRNMGTVSNSYSTGNVTSSELGGGITGFAGGLMGCNAGGTVSNSYYNCNEVLINGESIITTGALFGADFEEWLANGKFLDIDERLAQEDGYYVVNDVNDFKELLAFGQDESLRFKLTNDLDLAAEPNFYIPYLAGEFDGNGHKISNLSFNFDFVANVGSFGYLASGGEVRKLGVENVNINGGGAVGGLAGGSGGTVSNSYSTGNVTGIDCIGGLVGIHWGTVSNSYSTGSVYGYMRSTGGLVGYIDDYGTVSNSYSTGSVTGIGTDPVGGLVGYIYDYGTVSNSFWDTETSGQSESDGGIGKSTAEMQDISTFSDTETEGLDESWDIIAVANTGTRNLAYIWNIVDDATYPFLSWE